METLDFRINWASEAAASEDPRGLGPIRYIIAKSAAQTEGQTRLHQHQRPAEARRPSMERSTTKSHAGPSTWSTRSEVSPWRLEVTKQPQTARGKKTTHSGRNEVRPWKL